MEATATKAYTLVDAKHGAAAIPNFVETVHPGLNQRNKATKLVF